MKLEHEIKGAMQALKREEKNPNYLIVSEDFYYGELIGEHHFQPAWTQMKQGKGDTYLGLKVAVCFGSEKNWTVT